MNGLESKSAGMVVLKVMLAIACGAVTGLAAGIATAMGLGLYAQWTNPQDPSAGAVAILVIVTAPLGALIGIAIGILIVLWQPRLFAFTFIPATVLLLGWFAFASIMGAVDRPRDYVIELKGTPDAPFVGTISSDGGMTNKIKGTLPARFEFHRRRLDLAFALKTPGGETTIAVDVLANGASLHTGLTSQTGVSLHLSSSGYSEAFGGTSRSYGPLSAEQAAVLLNQ